ncbi:hypothetical protein ACWGDT_01790 [Streptomyces avermitilis]
MLDALNSREHSALSTHERAHLDGRHHRCLLVAGLAARANPFLPPMRASVAYTVERWAARTLRCGSGWRVTAARAVGKAALISRSAPIPRCRAPRRAESPPRWDQYRGPRRRDQATV